ncbi:MAG: colicin production protein [Flavipsychrobacter sp.]|nr:colicin production protein [Flavipsychrobacter sp.]
MILDVIGIIILILFFIRGYMRGIILAAFSVIAILLGVLCALKLSQTFAAYLLAKGYITSGWAQVVSYAVLFIAVVLTVRLIANLIQKAIETMMLGVVNRLIGGVLYALLGIVLWSSVLWIGNKMNMITPELITASKTYTYVSGVAPWCCEQAGKVIPFLKDTFSNLTHFFDTVNQKSQEHVGSH